MPRTSHWSLLGALQSLCLLALTLSPDFQPRADTAPAQPDGGDQFLDGIGETALIARYVFDGSTTDRSRNGLTATLLGPDASYVQDPRFGKVLSLPGTRGTCVQIPGQALDGLEAVAVTGWLLLRSDEPWQRFFDFGLNTTSNMFCAVTGETATEGHRARITTRGSAGEEGPLAASIPLRRWVHLATVLDPARHTLALYVDGECVARSSQTTLNLAQILAPGNPRHSRLYLGRSAYSQDPGLNALVHDVRLYGIALSDAQVRSIHRGARAGAQPAALAASAPTATPLGPAPDATPLRFTLSRVDDVQLSTSQGYLPRLPRTLRGTYQDGATAPEVRVIWPAPTNTDQVLQPGIYTLTGRVAGTTLQPRATITVIAAPATPRTAPPRSVDTFALDRVTLNPVDPKRPTPFMRHRDLFLQGLARTDPDRFLYMFRDTFGQAQPANARSLDGWDSQATRLRGHATGHYLTAIAQAYASTGYDPVLQAGFLQKMNYLVDTLHDLSRKSGTPGTEGGPATADPAAVPPGPGRSDYDSDLSAEGTRRDYWNWGVGFLSAYPPDQFIMLEKGATYGGGNNQIWAPYYTLHKILAGLLDCHELGGNPQALGIARGMGLWVQQRLQAVPPATRASMWSRYIAGEYGGMNEVLARLARLTGDTRFLDCARLFDNTAVFFGDAAHRHGLARNVDTFRGKHANQHIPQITGALETFRATGEHAYYDVAANFWDLCTEGYLYSIGGVAGARNPNNAECFPAEPDSLFANGFAPGGQNETCATYNLLKLSRQLFLFRQDARYMDYYEQALYNDILASVAAHDAGNTYHIPLNPGARKQFSNADMDGFTCCNGTALESATKLQDSIYFHGTHHQSLFVNLYVASTLHWKERQLSVTQQTRFPYSDTTRLTISGNGSFELNLRVPRWATRGCHLKLNGQPLAANAQPGSYVALRRTWVDQDCLEVQIPFSFHLHRVMDQPNIASLFYGPILLAAEEQEPRAQWRPVSLDQDDPGRSLSGDPATLRFHLGNLAFKPFYETYGRYSVYLDVTPR